MPRGIKKNKPGQGRPSKKTPELVAILTQLFYEGLHAETCCDIAGIDIATFYRWFNTDNDFAAKIRYSEARAIRELHNDVKKSDPWKILKSRKGKLYHDKLQQEISGSDGEPIRLVVEDYRTPEGEPNGETKAENETDAAPEDDEA